MLAALGLAHRDLGPEAVIEVDGEIGLRSFGRAYREGLREPPPDSGGYHVTHLPSAAPEVIQALDLGGLQADVYSLGAMLQRMLGDSWPAPERLGDVVRWILSGDCDGLSQPIAGAPEALDAVRRQALNMDPDERQTATEFAEGLEAWLEVPAARPEVQERRAPKDLAGRLHIRGVEPIPGPVSGDVIGARFRLGVRLKQSHLGEIFRATDLVRKTTCQVELILVSGQRSDAIDRLADREVRACRGITSPGLLRALAWGRLGPERVFIARELVPGLKPLNLSSGSVRQRVQRLATAARQLGSLNKQGVVHRDIGPHTILENADGEIYLSGFALAKRKNLDELESGGAPFSFLPTVAPEALLSVGTLGTGSDVYSLGALLFFALTNRYPFRGFARFGLLEQHEDVRSGEAEAPQPKDAAEEVPSHLNVVCRRALSLDVKRRPGRANAFALALEQWLEAEQEDGEDPDGEVRAGPTVDLGEPERAVPADSEDAPTVPGVASDLRVTSAASSSASILLREFPESLLISEDLAASFQHFLHVCLRCERRSYLLPPMTTQTSRCTHCKRGTLRPIGDVPAADDRDPSATLLESSDLPSESSDVLESSDLPSESSDVLESSEESSDVLVVESTDLLVESDDVPLESDDLVVESSDLLGESSESEVVVELPESLKAPPGLEVSLSTFKHTCVSCFEQSFLLPPMTPETARCTYCAGQLRPYRDGDEDLTAAEDLLASSDDGETGVTVTRRATGESRHGLRIPKASKLVSMARFRCECLRCGKTTFVLPPQTPKNSDCSHCGAALNPMAKADSDRLLEAVAAVASPSDSTFNLTTDGLALEESDHGTGFVSWSRPAPTRTPRPKKRPKGRRITRAQTLELDELIVRLDAAPPRAGATVRRRLNPALVLALFTALIVGGVWHAWPQQQPPVAPSVAPPKTPRTIAASAFDGRYRLWLGNKTIGASARSAWCILDVANLGNGTVGAEVWRPGIDMVCQRSLVSSSGTIELIVKRTYRIDSDHPPRGFEDLDDDGTVVELWELRGRLVGSGANARIEGKGKRKIRQWGKARSQRVRFIAERLSLSNESILEEVDLREAPKPPEPKPTEGGEGDPHGNPHR